MLVCNTEQEHPMWLFNISASNALYALRVFYGCHCVQTCVYSEQSSVVAPLKMWSKLQLGFLDVLLMFGAVTANDDDFVE